MALRTDWSCEGQEDLPATELFLSALRIWFVGVFFADPCF
jgi:hypothetical protein